MPVDAVTSQGHAPVKNLDIVVAEHWVGDPSAIRSVRRPRLRPNEMSDHSQPFGQARKLMVDMRKYPSCSRNCNKPGFDFDNTDDVTSRFPPVSTIALRRQARSLTKEWQSLPTLSKPSDVIADGAQVSVEVRSANGENVDLPKIQKSLTDPGVHRSDDVTNSARNRVKFTSGSQKRHSQESNETHLSSARTVQPPLDVLARIKRGNLKVPSLAEVTRKVTQSMDAADHRSITSRGDAIVCDRNNKFQQRRVTEVIRVQPTKATLT